MADDKKLSGKHLTLVEIATSIVYDAHGDAITLNKADAIALAKSYLSQPSTTLSLALEAVNAVEAKQLEAFDLRATVQDLDADVAAHEARIMEHVCSETDGESGKPVHTNDTQRKAACLRAASTDPNLRETRERQRAARRALAKLDGEIAQLSSTVSLRKAILNGGY